MEKQARAARAWGSSVPGAGAPGWRNHISPRRPISSTRDRRLRQVPTPMRAMRASSWSICSAAASACCWCCRKAVIWAASGRKDLGSPRGPRTPWPRWDSREVGKRPFLGIDAGGVGDLGLILGAALDVHEIIKDPGGFGEGIRQFALEHPEGQPDRPQAPQQRQAQHRDNEEELLLERHAGRSGTCPPARSGVIVAVPERSGLKDPIRACAPMGTLQRTPRGTRRSRCWWCRRSG